MLGTVCLERMRRLCCMLFASLCPKAAPCGGGIPARPGVLPSEGAASGAGGAPFAAALSAAVLLACAGGRAELELATSPFLLATLPCLLGQGGQASCLARACCVSTCCEFQFASLLPCASLLCCPRCCCCCCCWDCGGCWSSAAEVKAADPAGVGVWGVSYCCLHLLLLVLALLGQGCFAPQMVWPGTLPCPSARF